MAPFLGTACFSDLVVVPEGGAIPVASEIPFDALATIGCAVITGVGAVTNAGQVPKGARVAVIGAGGVGLNVVQGAAIAGCERIVAIDLRPRPLEHRAAIRRHGCDRRHDRRRDVPAEVRGVDGRARRGLRVRHGWQPVDVDAGVRLHSQGRRRRAHGAVAHGRAGTIPMFPFVMQEKRLLGSVYGSGQPARDIPKLVSLYQEGRLKLARTGVADLRTGRGQRRADGAGRERRRARRHTVVVGSRQSQSSVSGRMKKCEAGSVLT